MRDSPSKEADQVGAACKESQPSVSRHVRGCHTHRVTWCRVVSVYHVVSECVTWYNSVSCGIRGFHMVSEGVPRGVRGRVTWCERVSREVRWS